MGHKGVIFSVFNFKVCVYILIYCGKCEVQEERLRFANDEPKVAHKVVLDHMSNIEGKRHVITMNKFFYNC